MEGADQVLAESMVDCCLTADRTIDLAKQCSGYLNNANAAQVGCRDKACEIADHTAPNRDDHIGAFNSCFDQIGEQRLSRAQSFEALTVANQETANPEARAGQRPRGASAENRVDGHIAYDHGLPGSRSDRFARKLAQVIEKTR